MIKISFNKLGMVIFSCNHVKGYDKGKGQRLCSKCEKKLIKNINSKLIEGGNQKI